MGCLTRPFRYFDAAMLLTQSGAAARTFRYKFEFAGNTFVCAALLLAGCTTDHPRSLPEVSALPSQSPLPDPLIMLDGQRVSSPSEWFHQRRPELKAMFEHYVYGAIPPKPTELRTKRVGEYSDFLNGKATLKLVTLEVGPGSGHKLI